MALEKEIHSPELQKISDQLTCILRNPDSLEFVKDTTQDKHASRFYAPHGVIGNICYLWKDNAPKAVCINGEIWNISCEFPRIGRNNRAHFENTHQGQFISRQNKSAKNKGSIYGEWMEFVHTKSKTENYTRRALSILDPRL